MASADVRDVFDLPTGEAHARPLKKQKIVEKRPEGMTRELFSLLGERAAPVSITEHVKYKERPKWTHKVSPWEMRPFNNPAREDGLVLRHWQRKPAPALATAEVDRDEGDAAPSNESEENPIPQSYHYAKFNVKVNVPDYTDEEYERHLQHPDWSKGETDYLFDICRQYDLRWIVIGDRYDYRPLDIDSGEGAAHVKEESSTAVISRPKSRAVEHLKARYYHVSAILFAQRRPIQDMTPEEFAHHEMLSKFSAATETRRKEVATSLASRTSAEVEDEAILLTELRRIISNQDRLALERSEIYSVLQSPLSSQPSAIGSLYQSSAGLSQLMQILLQADKNKKRRSLLGPNADSGAAAVPSPTTAPNQPGHRDSQSGQPAQASATKKGASATQATPRTLSQAEEARYGVSYHEKLTAGTALRHERATKLAAGKSHVQSLRVSGALTELEIPARLVMPTAAVCEVFEQLVQRINVLLDIRKQRERVEGEVRVLEVSKGVNTGEEKTEETHVAEHEAVGGEESQISVDVAEKVADPDPDPDTKMDDGDALPASEQDGGHKRSASVLSQASQASTKRSRK